MTKLWLDDERPAPDASWTVAKNSFDTIELIRNNDFEVISLDHDLGLDAGIGYDVLLYLEAEVYHNYNFKCPKILIHTANNVARQRMAQAVNSIEKILTTQN